MKHIPALVISLCFSAVLSAQKNKPTANRLSGLYTAFARVLKNFKATGFAVAVQAIL